MYILRKDYDYLVRLNNTLNVEQQEMFLEALEELAGEEKKIDLEETEDDIEEGDERERLTKTIIKKIYKEIKG